MSALDRLESVSNFEKEVIGKGGRFVRVKVPRKGERLIAYNNAQVGRGDYAVIEPKSFEVDFTRENGKGFCNCYATRQDAYDGILNKLFG